MFETCFKHVSNGFKTRLNVFQTKTPKKRFTISPLFIWRVTYTKSVIQFTSDGGAGIDDGITFQIRYYGSHYNKNVRFLFYSRVIKGKQSTSFDHTIFNVSDVDDNHKILYFENLNLNGNLIDGLGDPAGLANATNKKYVTTEIAKISSGLLPLDVVEV